MNRDTRVATFIGGVLDGEMRHFAQALTNEYVVATSRVKVGEENIDVSGSVKAENECYRLEKLIGASKPPEHEFIYYVYILKGMSLRDAMARLLFYYRPTKEKWPN